MATVINEGNSQWWKTVGWFVSAMVGASLPMYSTYSNVHVRGCYWEGVLSSQCFSAYQYKERRELSFGGPLGSQFLVHTYSGHIMLKYVHQKLTHTIFYHDKN